MIITKIMQAQLDHSMDKQTSTTFSANVGSMLRTLGLAGMTALVSMSLSQAALANNPAPSVKVDAPLKYTVEKGDTLWGISGRYLNKPWEWKRIWATNPQIKNPHWIYPGDIIILCVIEGQTMIGIDTGEGCTGIEKIVKGEVKTDKQFIRTEPAESRIPPIPLSAIEAWLNRNVIVSPKNFENTPYVLASKNKNIITGDGSIIYVRGPLLQIGQRYGIYREGEPYYKNAQDKMEVLGLEATQVASGVVTDVASNGVSTIQLTASYGKEVREGDRAFVEFNDYLRPLFYPKLANPTSDIELVRVMDSIGAAAQGSVIAINAGTQQNLAAGDVLEVRRKGVLIRDDNSAGEAVRLPSERTGLVMVFKTFDNVSYAYTLSADVPLSIGDKLKAPTQFN